MTQRLHIRYDANELPTTPAGEPHLEPRHKIALLRIRHSDWSEAVLARLGALRRCSLNRNRKALAERQSRRLDPEGGIPGRL